MSITSTFTSDTLTETWSGGNNKSDSWSNAVADGGSITRKLGDPSSQTQNTVTHTSNGSSATIHMGTWVTDPAPEAFTIPTGATFGLNHICAWESAGQLNANVYFKISVVTEAGEVLSFDRALTDWKALQLGGGAVELGTSSGSNYPIGGASTGNGVNTHIPTLNGGTIQIGERLAIEVGIQTPGRNNDTVNFEYGSHSDTPDDAGLAAGQPGTGLYGSEVLLPLNFSEVNQNAWGSHAEILIPWVSGTDTIAWADVGTDYTAAKWETTGAKRYVNRYGGIPTSQFWIFQDDDYLYIAMNNIIDGCIQSSDHQQVFLCAGDDWTNELETDPLDWIFCRDITSGTSATRVPTLPVAVSDGNNQGEYVLQGLAAATYPEGWEIPTYTAGTKSYEFANSKIWQDGVDFRFGGPGATSAAPNPTAGSAGAYSELKVKKSTLNNWNGTDPLGIMLLLQCDVQANGSTLFPPLLGNQVDQLDWPWCGVRYDPLDVKTASTKESRDELDLRVLMSNHGHAVIEQGDINVNFDTLSLTENQAVVTHNVNVNTNPDSLGIVTYPAVVVNEIEITAGATQLDLNTYPATISQDINISANTSSLIVTTARASISTGLVQVPTEFFAGEQVIVNRNETNVPLWLAVNDSGGVAGLTVTGNIGDHTDPNSFLDFDDMTFKTSGWVQKDIALTDNGNGKYSYNLDLTAITNLPAGKHLWLNYDIAGSITGISSTTLTLSSVVDDVWNANSSNYPAGTTGGAVDDIPEEKIVAF